MFSYAKRRARDRGCEFTLKREDVTIPTHCPALGVEIDLTGEISANKPSLDRIDNTKGYTKENIQVISFRANRLKADASVEELQAIIAYMRENGVE